MSAWSHPLATEVLDYVERRLDDDEDQRVADHLRSCRWCRRGAVNMLNSAEGETDPAVYAVVNYDPRERP